MLEPILDLIEALVAGDLDTVREVCKTLNVDHAVVIQDWNDANAIL